MERRWNEFWKNHMKKRVFVKMKNGDEFEGVLSKFKVNHGNVVIDIDAGYDGKPKHRFIRDDFSYIDIERSGKKKGYVYAKKVC